VLTGAVESHGAAALVKVIRDDPGTARCLNLRVGAANLGEKAGHEEQHGLGCRVRQPCQRTLLTEGDRSTMLM
jgi:hypothetical protein